jgi:hypothetical protein
MTQFDGFDSKRLRILTADVKAALALSQKCVNALIYSPDGPRLAVKSLLMDTFMIPSSEFEHGEGWDKTGKVKTRFEMFSGRIKRTTLVYATKSPTDPGEMQLGAFVRPNEPRKIFVTSKYFDVGNAKTRAATLIHEFIHLVQKGKGHPGGVKIVFGGQTALEIPFEKAYENAYCYQYFAEWLK